jgi:formylglycine-generating enzyme required for sulfatase activity
VVRNGDADETIHRVPGEGVAFQDRFLIKGRLIAGPEMVVVPAGEFVMGSNEVDSEKPPRRVTIKSPFAVGRFAVTFDEWDAADLAHKPGDRGWGRGRRPVIDVSWEDAQAYVTWLSERTGKSYRLLSEAEWEYCCRAGTTTEYAFGDTITKQQAQFSEGEAGSAGMTVDVGKFLPNAWGLHDMHGNVWEWVEDNWHPDYKGAPQDGSVWPGGDTSLRVRRGGSWFLIPRDLRSANRDRNPPTFRNDVVGFRVARTH